MRELRPKMDGESWEDFSNRQQEHIMMLEDEIEMFYKLIPELQRMQNRCKDLLKFYEIHIGVTQYRKRRRPRTKTVEAAEEQVPDETED